MSVASRAAACAKPASLSATQSGWPIAPSSEAPMREVWVRPRRVTTGTPIHRASQVVVAPL